MSNIDQYSIGSLHYYAQIDSPAEYDSWNERRNADHRESKKDENHGTSASKICGGFIYLLREREFIKTSESVFKFGKTKSPNAYRRINSYPKGSEIYYIERVKDCDQLERDILAKMCINFNQRTDIGREYFEGNIDDIIGLIKSSL